MLADHQWGACDSQNMCQIMHLQGRLGTAIASQTRILTCQYRWTCANMILIILVFVVLMTTRSIIISFLIANNVLQQITNLFLLTTHYQMTACHFWRCWFAKNRERYHQLCSQIKCQCDYDCDSLSGPTHSRFILLIF